MTQTGPAPVSTVPPWRSWLAGALLGLVLGSLGTWIWHERAESTDAQSAEATVIALIGDDGVCLGDSSLGPANHASTCGRVLLGPGVAGVRSLEDLIDRRWHVSRVPEWRTGGARHLLVLERPARP